MNKKVTNDTRQCKQCGMLYETNIKYSCFYAGKCDRCIGYHLNAEASRYNSLCTTGNGKGTSKETDIPKQTWYNGAGDRRTNSHPGGLW